MTGAPIGDVFCFGGKPTAGDSGRLGFMRASLFILGLPALILPASHAQLREVRSKNFVLHTDLEEKKARELSTRMETMLGIISQYWRAPNQKPIVCYVADDVSKWPATALSPQLLDIVSNRGVTIAQGTRRGRQVRLNATVYASNRFGTPLHEAVHAYCFQAFGTNGPVWYGEGMAEVGNYWKDGSSEVNAPEYVIQFLRQSPRVPLKKITEPKQKTGDGWQQYAWRWALCHFMVNNRNYRERFRVLGISFMQRRAAAFDRTFRSKMPELEFEFDLFMKHLQRGYDVDRCTWDWKVRAKEIDVDDSVEKKLRADYGWQPVKLKAQEGERFQFTVDGSWRIESGEDTDPSKQRTPNSGAIAAAVYDDHKLSPEFLISPGEPFEFPQDGQLVLRCQDEWNSLGDNSGSVNVTLKRTTD